MTDANRYYHKFGEIDEEEIEGVVASPCNVALDQIDTCTVYMLSDNRTEWKKILKNKLFKKIRRSDSFVEFRGWITEVRYADTDRYNMILKVKSKLKVLSELTSHITAEHHAPDTISFIDANTIKGSEPFVAPDPYTEDYCAVLIVPGEDPVFRRDDVEDSLVFSADAIVDSGTFADLNDDDPDTGINFYKINTQELFIEIKGSSTNAKAGVIGGKFEFIANVKVGVQTVTTKLEYWDGDSWEQIGDDGSSGPKPDFTIGYVWAGNLTFGLEWLDTNAFLDGSDDFRFRLIFTTSGNVRIQAKVVSAKIEIYTDAKYNGSYFPITLFHDSSDAHVSGDPADAGVDVGDTMVIGWQDVLILAEIFNEYEKIDLPFTINIDSNFVGYTARKFYDMDLMQCLQYFCDKQRAHYWFDHHNDTLYIAKETTITTDGTPRTITESDVETFNHDDKEEQFLKSVTVVGAAYKRGDGEDISAEYTYPDWEVEATGRGPTRARKELIINNAEITSWTECRELAKSIFDQSYESTLSALIVLAAYQDAFVLTDKLTVTNDLNGIVIAGEPIVGVNTTYDVENDLAIKTIQVGWQRTPLEKRQSKIINKLASQIKDLQRYARGLQVQADKLLRVDGVIEGENITFESLTLSKGDNDVEIVKVDNVAQLNIAGLMEIAQDITSLGEVISHGGIKLVDGDNDVVISKTADVAEVTFTDTKVIAANMKCQNLFAAANSVSIGNLILSESLGLLILTGVTPGVSIRDSDTTRAAGAYGGLAFFDSASTLIGQVVCDYGVYDGIMMGVSHASGKVRLVPGASGWVEISGDVKMGGYDIINPLEIRYSGTSKPFIQLYETDVVSTYGPYVQLGRSGGDSILLSPWHNAAGALTDLYISTLSSGGASAAGFGDIVFRPDNVEKMRIKANGTIQIIGDMVLNNITFATVLGFTGAYALIQGTGYVKLSPSTYCQIDASSIYNDLSGIFFIRDKDDSSEELLKLDTSGRTLRIGAADGNDDIVTSFYGSVSVSKRLTLSADLVIKAATAFDGTIGHNITQARNYLLPDASGTFVLACDYINQGDFAISGKLGFGKKQDLEGQMWLEDDGLHILYKGKERVL